MTLSSSVVPIPISWSRTKGPESTIPCTSSGSSVAALCESENESESESENERRESELACVSCVQSRRKRENYQTAAAEAMLLPKTITPREMPMPK